MSNGTQASYFCIGLTLIMGVAAIVGVLIYIGGIGDTRNELLVESYYDKPVAGLSVGSAVNYRGVRLGEVRKISFVGSEYDTKDADRYRIYMLFALKMKEKGYLDADHAEREAVVRQLVGRGLRATVASSAITGISHIELDFFKPEDAPPTEISWTPRHVLVPPKMSLLDNFSDSATKVMNQINRMDLNAFWSNINASAESVSAATLSARHLVEGYQPGIERLVQNLEEATASLKVFAEEIRQNPGAIFKNVVPERLPETTAP